MDVRKLLFGIPVLALAMTLVPRPAPAATTPAIAAFDEMFERINDYTVTIRAHEVKGDRTQDRTYQYWFKKPTMAKTLITSGDGQGGGGVWKGGDTVSGHQGGMLSFIHLTVSIHDGRATSLRGYTIPQGLLQNEVDKYKETKGELTQRAGPLIDGAPTDVIELKVADPAANDGVTQMEMFLNKDTHWPVRQLRWAGSQIVADETFLNLKTNVGLKDSDF
jgi:outer membrane lipoprotein-sorting protein